MKKVLVLGNKWHGNWSTSLSTELENIGIPSIHINVHPALTGPVYRIKQLWKIIFLKKLRSQLSEIFKKQKITHIIIIDPHPIPYVIWEDLKKTNIPLIGWLGDNPMTKGNLAKVLPLFNAIHLVDEQWSHAISHLHPNIYVTPHGTPTSYFYPIASTEIKNDIVFVGDSFNGNMNGLLRTTAIKRLHDAGFSVKLYGDRGWLSLANKHPFITNMYKGVITSQEELNIIYNSSKIILNLHHSQLISGTNQRTFEVAGAGAFQIADYRFDIKRYFDTSIPTFKTIDELIKLTTYFLNNQIKRNLLANTALQITLQEHTYKHRINKLLNTNFQ